MKLRQSVLPFAAAGLLVSVSAQQAQPVIEFEVASIKPNKSGSNSSGTHQTNGRWRGENNTIKSLIVQAYDVLPEQITGAPSWLDSERFDIEARYEQDAAVSNADERKQIQLRLRALLESRFQFQMHRESKEWQAYVLVAGKKGAKLTPTEKKEGSSTNSNNGHMVCTGVSMDGLARTLAGRLGRPVVNETAMEGRFDFTLDFEPEAQTLRVSDKNSPIAGVGSLRPSLFSALQDQLGLKLESKKAPVEMLVVDRVERPSEN